MRALLFLLCRDNSLLHFSHLMAWADTSASQYGQEQSPNAKMKTPIPLQLHSLLLTYVRTFLP